MKRTKKLLALLMVCVLVLGLTACGSGGGESSSAQSGTSSAGGTESGRTESVETAEADYSEKMTISYAAVAMVEGVDYNADELSQYFQDKFNIEWEPIALTWDNWAEKLRIWINSNDMPDFVMWDFNYGDYVNYAEQGLIRQLPNGWKDRLAEHGRGLCQHRYRRCPGGENGRRLYDSPCDLL